MQGGPVPDRLLVTRGFRASYGVNLPVRGAFGTKFRLGDHLPQSADAVSTCACRPKGHIVGVRAGFILAPARIAITWSACRRAGRPCVRSAARPCWRNRSSYRMAGAAAWPFRVSSTAGAANHVSWRVTRRRPSAFQLPDERCEYLGAWDTSAAISVSGDPSRGTRKSRIFGLSRTLTSSARPEGSATTRLPARILSRLTTRGRNRPDRASRGEIQRAAIRGGGQRDDFALAWSDAASNAPGFHLRERNRCSRYRTNQERDLAWAGGRDGCRSFLRGRDHCNRLLPWLHHHQACAIRIEHRQDHAPIRQDGKQVGIRDLRKPSPRFRLIAIQRAAHQFRREVRYAGIHASIGGSIQAPDFVGRGKQRLGRPASVGGDGRAPA